MIMKKLLLAIACAVGWFSAQAATSFVQYDTTSKLIVLPTNLFLANTSSLTAALTASGWSSGGGGGTGNADTNAANAWAAGYTQTFLGPVLWGATNAIEEMASKVTGPATATDSVLALFNGTTGNLIKNGTLTESAIATDAEVAAAYAPIASPAFTGTATFESMSVGTLAITNPFPARGVSNAVANRFAIFGADNRLTNDVAETGSGAPVRAVSPALTGTPTVNGTNLMAAIAAGGGGGGDVYLANSNKFTAAAVWTNSFVQIQGNTTGTSPVNGEGIELRYDSDDGTFGANGLGSLATYDRNSTAWTDLRIMGAAVVIAPVGTALATFTNGQVVVAGQVSVVDNAYGAGWNGSANVPTKNAVYDEMELRAPKASPALTGTPTVNGTNLMAYIASSAGSGGGGGLTLVDASAITNVNFRSSWANKALVSGVTNVDWVPQPPTTASATSLTPAFNSSRGHEFTLTGNATLNAPSGVTSDMVGDTFRLVFIQDSTGGRTLSTATNYLFGSDITWLTLTTNAGARDYAVVYVRRTNVFDVVGFVRGYAQ